MNSQEITVPSLAKRLGCTIPRAQALIRTGAIHGRKGANGWMTTSLMVEAYLAKRAHPPTPSTPKIDPSEDDSGTRGT